MVLVEVKAAGVVPNLRNVVTNYPKWFPFPPKWSEIDLEAAEWRIPAEVLELPHPCIRLGHQKTAPPPGSRGRGSQVADRASRSTSASSSSRSTGFLSG